MADGGTGDVVAVKGAGEAGASAAAGVAGGEANCHPVLAAEAKEPDWTPSVCTVTLANVALGH